MNRDAIEVGAFSWARIQRQYEADAVVHWERCEAEGLQCPQEVFTHFSVGRAVRASMHSLDDGEPGARARLASRISSTVALQSVAPSLVQGRPAGRSKLQQSGNWRRKRRNSEEPGETGRHRAKISNFQLRLGRLLVPNISAELHSICAAFLSLYFVGLLAQRLR
jgi:hypothetical protein